MPELPEVETVCRGLRPVLEGAVLKDIILRRQNLRTAFPKNMAALLKNQQVIKLERRAKYILAHLENAHTLIIHLGMSGRMLIMPDTRKPQKHDHVIFETDNGARIVFNDPRRFGMMDVVETAALVTHKNLRHLGPEPLSKRFDVPYVVAALKPRKSAIKIAIMDQELVVGVGNIYASEALFEAGIHPARPAYSLSKNAITKLVAAIKNVLSRAIEKGGSSLRDYVQADGGLGYFQHEFAVYDRAGEACKGCTCSIKKTGGVKRMVQGGRATFYCSEKQRGSRKV